MSFPFSISPHFLLPLLLKKKKNATEDYLKMWTIRLECKQRKKKKKLKHSSHRGSMFVSPQCSRSIFLKVQRIKSRITITTAILIQHISMKGVHLNSVSNVNKNPAVQHGRGATLYVDIKGSFEGNENTMILDLRELYTN